MKQRKEEMVEKCLEAYFHLTVKEEECCLFQDKNGNLHKPHHKENEMYVFLQESPKTDVITYVKELHPFCTKIIKYAMETKELKIEIPTGYEIDRENSTFEKIVFKKKEDTRSPRNWQEYCEFAKATYKHGYMIDDYTCDIDEVDFCNLKEQETENWRNVLPSSKLAKAFRAMMQLISLRQAWIHKWSVDNGMTDDWEPNWTEMRAKWNIIYWQNQPIIYATYLESRTLSFPKKEMAEDFMNCFKDLLETAKPLV